MDATTGQASKPWLSVKEAAEWPGLARSSVYDLVAAGKLACYRTGPKGGGIRFRASDLDAYLEGCRVGPKVEAEAPPKPVRRRPPKPKYSYDW